jgi:hypothetical protein
MTTQSEIAKWFETLPEELQSRIIESAAPPDDSDLYVHPGEVQRRELDAAREVYGMETDGGGAVGLEYPDEIPLGASPAIPGATRGLPPEIGGLNTDEENKRRMMMEALRESQSQGQRY